jgi:glutamate-1-semialdehyde 2,1-aminomutase
MNEPLGLGTMGSLVLASALGAALLVLPKAKRRLELSLAKHPSLTGHSRMAKRVASLLPGFSYDEARFFAADDAPADVVARRRAGFAQLAHTLNTRHAGSIELTRQTRQRLSDLQFTSAYRVPFPFSRLVRERLSIASFVASSEGVSFTDLDGERFIDLTGSYGVNLFGQDFYKHCIAEAARRAEALGPVLGSYHPSVAFNVEELARLSGQDEVSFHMSGTEAVMQAVRLARYHTGRKYLVRFSGAYHGWWEDVQPGPGNPLPPGHTYTLKEMDSDTLRVLRKRTDIACVLVNPLQALHPNRAAPGDSGLVDSSRSAGYDRAAYRAWLAELRAVCSERGIVLIFDEVFMGFRLAPGGAQAYFGIRADMVTYGKTLGGGLPVGVVCGQAALMKRWRDDRPADICFARGTFNAHPYVMTAMQVFLERLRTPEVLGLYNQLDAVWDARAARLNQRLADEGLPVRVANLSTVWTVTYTAPSRYNWMLQFYLRRERLALSWVGSGRIVFGLHFSERDFDDVMERFVTAARAMRDDGWWWQGAALTNQSIRRGLLREMLSHWRSRGTAR